ncbi:MAG: hypothetical protein K0R26_1647 [Bacteroidota bacterium]|jgi:hypothetical protein|nr:hypothetical protein [Bacteroidota bacterium]
MKKIYLSISAVMLSACAIAQQSFMQQAVLGVQKQTYVGKSAERAPVKNKKVTTANFSGRFDPSYALPTAHGKTVGGTGDDYGIYVDPIFVDTTVKSSFSTASIIDGHNYGVTFDPKSIIFDQVNFQPLLTPTDSYFLDTVWIGGVYQRRGHTVDDTLIVEVVWGDTANTAVFARYAYSTASPNLNAMGYWAVPKFTTSLGNGDKIRYSAPLTNRKTFKHVLTKADSTYMADVSDYLPIAVNGTLGQLIPAGNIVSCGYSFNAGGTHANGDISYASPSSPAPGTVSGWAAVEFAQDVPALNSIADVSDGYDDFGTGKNGSNYILKKGRYLQEAGAFATAGRAAFYLGYWIDFSIHFTNTVTKVSELENKGFALGQNSPNPFSKSSSVKFELAKDVKSAVFTVTDVMGRVISTENVGTTAGTHTVNLNTLASGVYYYSLNVDGNVSTKKMIVE